MASLCEEESQLLADSKYRSYVAIIEKALKGFESTSEWADLISTLAKLNKVLLSHTKYPIVPRRIIISKRLAQCMHPALPSGVHLKALETYDIIFRSMGTNRLSQELFIYSAGLFPVFVSAAMNVRSALLTIYESHFVPLGQRLRPGLNGFLSGILPGLEEGSDHLERTSQLLLRVAEGVGQTEFFGSLWECIAGNGSIRLPAINHITSCYNKRLSTDDQLFILGTDLDVMVCGLCSSLVEGGVMVQRAALDLTLTALPLHNTRLLLRHDTVRLVGAALIALLRRDTSLNRRLYSWLLGLEVNTSMLPSSHPVIKRLSSTASNADDDQSYFAAFSKELLVEGLVCCFKDSEGALPPDLRPYKLMVALLDKQEVGPLILDDILLDMLRCLYHSSGALSEPSSQASSDVPASRRQSTTQAIQYPKDGSSSAGTAVKGSGSLELHKSAGLVFSAMQPSYPWLRMLRLLTQACTALVRSGLGLSRASSIQANHDRNDEEEMVRRVGAGGPHFTEVCTLMSLMLNTLPLDTQQQTEAARIMEVLSAVTSLITDHLDILSPSQLLVGVKLCHSILQKLIPSVTLPIQDGSSNGGVNPESSSLSSQIRARVSESAVPSYRSSPVASSYQISPHHISSNFAAGGVNSSYSYLTNSPVVEEASYNSSSSSMSSNEDICQGIVQIGIEANESTIQAESVDNSAKIADERSSSEQPTDTDVSSASPVGADNTSNATHESTPDSSLPPYTAGGSPASIPHSSNEVHARVDRGAQHECPEDGAAKVCTSSALYSYVTEFEKLFTSFIQKALLSDNSQILQEFQHILFGSSLENNNVIELKSLLKECLLCTMEQEVSADVASSSNFYNISKHFGKANNTDRKPSSASVGPTNLMALVTLSDNFKDNLETFEVMCSILIVLSSIPTTSGRPYHFASTVATVCSSSSSVDDSTHSSRCGTLPSWLISLICCCCSNSRTLQHAALSTLLELLTLAQSELSVWKDGGGTLAPNPAAGEDGVVTINIIPRIHPTHLHLLLHHTSLYQQVSQWLWQQLDLMECRRQVHSVELLLQLHAITSAPTNTLSGHASKAWSTCNSSGEPSLVERELLSELNTPIAKGENTAADTYSHSGAVWSHGGLLPQYNISAIQKWLTLWQLSRHSPSASHTSPLGLDRCLFLMLERVRSGSGGERSLAQRWLCHSLVSGDSARILDPVLCLLLHPHTRRVSVQHVTVRQIHLPNAGDMLVLGSRSLPSESQDPSNSQVYDGSSDSLIYAISSVAGEVMYHVSKEPLRDKTPAKKFLSSAARHILALTSMTKDNKKYVTENIELPEYEVPYMGDKNSPGQQHISVLVNPFSQHPWLEIDDMTQINKNLQSSNMSLNSAEKQQPSQGDGEQTDTNKNADTGNDDIKVKSLDLKNVLKECPSGESSVVCTPSSEAASEVSLSANDIATSVMDEILSRVIQRCAPSPPLSDPESSSASTDTPLKTGTNASSDLKPPDMTLHPLHSHMLLYTQLVDSGHCLYGLRLLKNIIEAQPKLSLLSLASTGISTLQPPSILMILLARHKKCVFGHGFDGGNESEMIGQYRSTMYLQVVITVCLYYLRSYYLRLPHLRLKDEHLNDNKEVQVVAIEVLVLVFTNLSALVADSPRGLAPFVLDLLNKCKVQKCVLHCLLATVHAMRLPSNILANRKGHHATETKTFTQELLDYNNRTSDGQCLAGQETYLSNAMDLTLALIKLEDALAATKIDSLPREGTGTTSKSSTSSNHYQVGLSIPAQPMFLRVISSALGQKHTRHLHSAWLHLFTSALPHMGPALPTNCLRLCSLLCVLIEELPKYYTSTDLTQLKPIPPDYALTLLAALTTITHFCLLDPSQSPLTVSPSATSYVHPSHLLSGPSSSLSLSSAGSSSGASVHAASTSNLSSSSSNTPGQILFNLLHVFSPSGEVMEASLDTTSQEPLTCARRTLLSHLPRIVAAVSSLWSVTYSSPQLHRKGSMQFERKSDGESHIPQPHCLAGSSSAVVQQVVTFLSPICHHHTPQFIAAVSVVWQSLAEDTHQPSQFLPTWPSSARSDSTSAVPSAGLQRSSSFVALKNTSSSSSGRLLNGGDLGGGKCGSLQDVAAAASHANDKKKTLRHSSQSEERSQSNDAASCSTDSLTATDDHLAKEADIQRNRLMLVKMVGAIRVLPLHVLLDTVKLVLRTPPTVEGFMQTVSVEVSVLELVQSYVSSSSSQQLGACWSPLLSLLKEAVLCLMPNALLLLLPILNDFVQRAPPLQDKKEIRELQDVSGRLIESVSNVAGSCLETTTWLRRNLTVKTQVDRHDPNNAWSLSVAALEVLATEVAALLDVLYSSEDKDKLLPLLTQLMTHVTPYLKNHTQSNTTAFLSCSRLVASLSGYQYTLKAWRKDVLELLLDPNAFRMTPSALPYWRTIIDNLYTHDKTMFKELLARVSLSQGGTLNLFSSKESEYEMRAMLLKRLAFTIFCSEPDQYSKYFPDIQERVTEISRLSEVVPVLVGAVLNVVAVIVVRISPRTLVSLWPAIITEMVQVFLVMEQQLAQDTAMFSEHLKRVSALDSRWVVSSSNSVGLRSLSHPAWLSLYLSACKLLDLLLALPAHNLPQFQMYRWAFVGSSGANQCSTSSSSGDAAIGQNNKSDTPTGSIIMKSCEFVPHVIRIARLMNDKQKNSKTNDGVKSTPVELDLSSPHHLLLGKVTSVNTLMDLQPFFQQLCVNTSSTTQGRHLNNSSSSSTYSTPAHHPHPSLNVVTRQENQLRHIESALERNFLEPLM